MKSKKVKSSGGKKNYENLDSIGASLEKHPSEINILSLNR
jgi:hypothetical protein